MPEEATGSGASPLRVLVLVLAYRDPDSLCRVLDRIPLDLLDDHEIEVLILDAEPRGGTFGAALDWAEGASSRVATTVLQNPRPSGYGGDLKLGFEYAIANGFDQVALLRGDGKFAPEALPRLLGPIAAGSADVTIGSRFGGGAGPPQSRMPWFRSLANRLLSGVLRRLLGTSLIDLHGGYRAYSTAVLRRIPFQRNADDLRFDTDLLVQLLRARARILEVPVPAYYGKYGATRSSFGYALGSLQAGLGDVLDKLGIRYQRRYDIVGGPAEYAIKLGYSSSHSMAVEAVSPGSRVLDIGCGRGFVSELLLKKGCYVLGVDRQRPDSQRISEFLDWEGGRDPLPVRPADFDYLLLLDIIEHLPEPERFLESIRQASELNPPTVVLTTPNVAFLPMRLMLLLGQFNYGKEGILDLTHTRLFTFGSLERLAEECGYEILATRGVPAPFPKALGDSTLSRLLVRANSGLIRISRSLFSYQIFMLLRPLPTVQALLAETLRHSAQKARERRDGQDPSRPE